MQSKAYIPKWQKGKSCRKTYSVALNKRRTVIVDTPNFKGPNLGHFFDDNPSEIVHFFGKVKQTTIIDNTL